MARLEFSPENESYPYVIKDIPISEFTIPNYQRTRVVSADKGDRIVETIRQYYWEPALGVAIANSRADGTIVLIDGHGRKSALELDWKPGEPQPTIPTLMYLNMTLHDEIGLFGIMNKNRKPMSEWDYFHAELDDDGSSEAQRIVAVLRPFGIEVRNSSGTKFIAASTILRDSYRKGVLKRAASIIQEAWGNPDGTYDQTALQQLNFGGLVTFLMYARNSNGNKFPPEADAELVERLIKKRLSTVVDAVKKAARGGTNEKTQMAYAIAAAWNYKRTENGNRFYRVRTQARENNVANFDPGKVTRNELGHFTSGGNGGMGAHKGKFSDL